MSGSFKLDTPGLVILQDTGFITDAMRTIFQPESYEGVCVLVMHFFATAMHAVIVFAVISCGDAERRKRIHIYAVRLISIYNI